MILARVLDRRPRGLLIAVCLPTVSEEIRLVPLRLDPDA